ncbi:CotH kinase family protein [Paracrocinitomix mangrovi]|uniref:CotH kinase family protein n=1 Tax=Paracrocinitomix mangrovi TaxID=2862509 RepID=UPI001C8D5DB2|nr:CotH kinase family protein [Paracrocinitomix mangrovi]UKN02853.1 CotH kinase family protein [Paracrocinitomix mangrovi]
MMWKKAKIDQLLIFYVLALGLIGLSWKYGLVELTESDITQQNEKFLAENNLQIVGNGGDIQKVEAYNPAMKIHVSIDGGEHFVPFGDKIDLSDFENSTNIYYPASIRWKPAFNEAKKLKSLVVILENQTTKTRSNRKFLTSLEGIDTDLAIVNLSIPNNELFDPVNGLLVFGKASWQNQDFQESWWDRDANFTQRGAEWERECQFQYFVDNELVLDQNVGLRISGNATRGFPQKSFKINARTKYGKDKLKYKFFGKGGLKKYESLVIRMSGNDNVKTMFADCLMQDLAAESNVLIQKYQAVRLYINGNYWGLHNLRERIDDYFIAKTSGAKKSEITILETGSAYLKNGSNKDRDEFIKLIDELKSVESVDGELYDKVKEEISIKSFIDYIFFETYYANNDWPSNNSICYKAKGEKWKWMLNDLDYSLAYPGEQNVNLNMFERAEKLEDVHSILFCKLLTNKKFKEKFKSTCDNNIQQYFNEEKVLEKYNVFMNTYRPEIQLQLDRWRNISSVEVWEENCDKNLKFLLNRKDVYQAQLDQL